MSEVEYKRLRRAAKLLVKARAAEDRARPDLVNRLRAKARVLLAKPAA